MRIRTSPAVALVALLAWTGSLGCPSPSPSGSAPTSGTGSASVAAGSSGALSGKDAVAQAALVLDVRSPEEFASGHLARAENVPVDEVPGRVDAIAAKLGGDKTKPVAVYCARGGRAAKAKTALEQAGFTNVTNAGGYDALRD
jgi:phage shock protein E